MVSLLHKHISLLVFLFALGGNFTCEAMGVSQPFHLLEQMEKVENTDNVQIQQDKLHFFKEAPAHRTSQEVPKELPLVEEKSEEELEDSDKKRLDKQVFLTILTCVHLKIDGNVVTPLLPRCEGLGGIDSDHLYLVFQVFRI